MIVGVFFSLIGYVYSRILLEDILLPWHRTILKLPTWLYKPLGGCAVCFTGQLTFWGMLPFWKWHYQTIIVYFGIIALNIIIVKTLLYAEKD